MSRQGNFEDGVVKPAICVIFSHGSDTRNRITMKTSLSRNLMLVQEYIGPDYTPQTISMVRISSQGSRLPVERKTESEDPRALGLNHGCIGIIDRCEILIL